MVRNMVREPPKDSELVREMLRIVREQLVCDPQTAPKRQNWSGRCPKLVQELPNWFAPGIFPGLGDADLVRGIPRIGPGAARKTPQFVYKMARFGPGAARNSIDLALELVWETLKTTRIGPGVSSAQGFLGAS